MRLSQQGQPKMWGLCPTARLQWATEVLQTSQALPNAMPWGRAVWWRWLLGATTAYLGEKKTNSQCVPATQSCCCCSLAGSGGPGGGWPRAWQVAFAHLPFYIPQMFVGAQNALWCDRITTVIPNIPSPIWIELVDRTGLDRPCHHSSQPPPETAVLHGRGKRMCLDVSITFSNVSEPWNLKFVQYNTLQKSYVEAEEHVLVKTASLSCTAQGRSAESWTCIKLVTSCFCFLLWLGKLVASGVFKQILCRMAITSFKSLYKQFNLMLLYK